MRMDVLRDMLKRVDRSNDGFVHAVMSYVKSPGNEGKQEIIKNYIEDHPEANSSDVLQFMIDKAGFFVTTNKEDYVGES